MREMRQTFRFASTSARALADLLATAPLVGADSIFGNRSVQSTRTEAGVRHLKGFEPVPVPLFRFDIELRQRLAGSGAIVVLEFSQPELDRPYLAGQFVWELEDGPDGTAVLREEINTPAALGIVSRPLHGASPSLRRWLFFTGGHQRVMMEVAANLRSLLAAPAGH